MWQEIHSYHSLSVEDIGRHIQGTYMAQGMSFKHVTFGMIIDCMIISYTSPKCIAKIWHDESTFGSHLKYRIFRNCETEIWLHMNYIWIGRKTGDNWIFQMLEIRNIIKTHLKNPWKSNHWVEQKSRDSYRPKCFVVKQVIDYIWWYL